MLSGYQCQIVAFALDGEYLCPDCAREATSSVTVDKAERGLTTAYDISPVSRYELDEYNGERASEHADEEVGPYEFGKDAETHRQQEAWQKAYDDYPPECCGGCGAELD